METESSAFGGLQALFVLLAFAAIVILKDRIAKSRHGGASNDSGGGVSGDADSGCGGDGGD